MDTYSAIISKRDTRAFDSRPVPEETLRRILQAGRMAGSSKNTRPVRFVVLQRPERRTALAACGDFSQHMHDAPLCIAVVLTPDGGPFDAGRAAQNMMVAAWADGITSCPTSMHHPECAAETLGLPPDHRVAIVLALGYPPPGRARRARPELRRLPLDEMVHWETW